MFAGIEMSLGIAQPDAVRTFRHQTHFDPVLGPVIDCPVGEVGRLEIGVQEPVDHLQHVQIERGGHALGVIIGRFQNRAGFH